MTKKNRVDGLIGRFIDEQGDRYFTKEEITLKVLAALRPVPPWKGVPLESIMKEHIKHRMDQLRLHKEDRFRQRLYENYSTGEGYRWQKFTGMTLRELRVCVAAREKQIIGHERVVSVYRDLIEDLQAVGGDSARVRQVYDHDQGRLARTQTGTRG